MQYLKIGKTNSEMFTTTSGIPQSSTLERLLYFLCINDMHKCSQKLPFCIFADDKYGFCFSKCASELKSGMNEDFQLLLNYCNTNKLSVNLKKTHYMIIISTTKNILNKSC